MPTTGRPSPTWRTTRSSTSCPASRTLIDVAGWIDSSVSWNERIRFGALDTFGHLRRGLCRRLAQGDSGGRSLPRRQPAGPVGAGHLGFLARNLIARMAGEGRFEAMPLDGSLCDYVPVFHD